MTRSRGGLTTRASCLLAAGITAVLCGVLLGETDLVRAGVLAAAVPIAAAFVVNRSRVQVANRRAVEPHRATAGQAVTVHLTITNRSLLPTGPLMLEDHLPDRLEGRARFVLDSLSGHEARTVSYRMPNLARGHYRAGPLRIRLTDPFHMIDVVRAFTATSDFVVAPIVDPLPPIDPPRSDETGESSGSHSVGAHGADDASTREYRTGDDLRKIHWRSSARTGALMVRQEERPWRAQSTVLLDLRASAHVAAADPEAAGSPDPRLTDSLEWAVSAAASIGAQALRSGRDVGLITHTTSSERLRFGDATTLATHLATVRPVAATGLSTLSGPMRTATRDSALIAVLGRLDPASLRQLCEAPPRGQGISSFALVIDVDTWADEADEADGADGLHPGAANPVPGDAEAAAAVLRASGWRAVVVRRGMGTAQAWQTLLNGIGASTRLTQVRR